MTSPDVHVITKLLSDKSRTAILDILMDGTAHTVNEIASYTKIKQHTVSYHLKLLTEAGLTTVQAYGKFRYYSLSHTPTAKIFEALSNFSPEQPIKSYNQHFKKKKLKHARTCYDHIAGELGVAITDAFLFHQYIDEKGKEFIVTEKGYQYFTSHLHIDIDSLYYKKRKFCIKCLDWSERKNHLAGALGKAILDYLQNQHFIKCSATSRSLTVSQEGKKFLKEEWGIDFNE